MAPFRPTNVNVRLVSNTGGNAGVVGLRTCPFTPIALGCRCDNAPGAGRFNLNEIYCQAKNPLSDCKGFLICCSGTIKYFIAPSCTEVARPAGTGSGTVDDAVTVANSCMGSCGWFVPQLSMLRTFGQCWRYWDTRTQTTMTYYGTNYWYRSSESHPQGWWVTRADDTNYGNNGIDGNNLSVRAFRCTPT